MSTKQPAVTMVSRSNRRSPFLHLGPRLPIIISVLFCRSFKRAWQHEEFHFINLSNVCVFMGDEIGSKITKYVFKAENGRLPIVIRQPSCLVDMHSGQCEKQPQHWSSRLLVVGFFLTMVCTERKFRLVS